MTDVTLSLIAHTNVGKTTLARTLLRRDVGEVLDRAHVTEVSEAHELIAADGHVLRLWDTPGFGDSARLLARLKQESSPIGWLLHQVWDRVADRPLWCSQEAVRNVRDDADVVLYLVNAAEDPRGAGYVDLELAILDWVGKPVLVLLNQTGEPGAARDDEERWRAALAHHGVVRDVLGLDAFSRCWVQEGVLLARIATHLDGERAQAMRVLTAAWNARLREVFEASVERMAGFLADALGEREPLKGGLAGRGEKRKAMEALALRLEAAERALWDEVIALHGIEGHAAVELMDRMEHVDVSGEEPLDERKSALLGSVVSGALGGLAADVLAGGLTFGGGLVAGALLGALGGAGLSRGYRLVRGEVTPEVRWSPALLDALARRTVMRYLAVSHSGRGRGAFEESEPLEHWRQAVERELGADVLVGAADQAAIAARVKGALERVLEAAYPQAGNVLRAGA